MSELSDDEFMNMGTPPSAPSGEMSDDQFMNAGAAPASISKLDTARQAEATSPAAALTGYAANIADTIPGMHQVGSGIAAAAGFGKGDRFGQRYQDLEASQNAMRTAGQEEYPAATKLGQISSMLPAAGSLVEGAGKLSTGAIKNLGNAATKDMRPTADQIRDISGRLYDKAKNIGAIFTPEASEQAATSVENAVKQSGKLNDRLHGDTMSVLDDFKNDAANKNLDLEDLQQYRQLFGDVVNKNLYPNGKMMPDAMKASQAQDAIDQFLNKADSNHIVNGSTEGIQALNDARSLWSQSARMDDVQRIMERAELSQNPATAMREGFKNLATNGRRIRGFTDDEQALIKQAAQSSLPMEYLRAAGSRLLGIAGMGSGNLTEMVAAPAVNAAARGLASRMQASRGNDILDALANRNELPDLNFKMPQGRTALPAPAIEVPPGGFGTVAPIAEQATPYQGMRQLPNHFYAPDSRTLTYQPGADFQVTPEGWASQPATTVIRQNPKLSEEMGDAGQSFKQTAKRAAQKRLTYQPRQDFTATQEGITQQEGDTSLPDTIFGESEGMPIEVPGELKAIRKGAPKQAKGGRVHKKPIKKTRSGVVYARPKRYPALEAMRSR